MTGRIDIRGRAMELEHAAFFIGLFPAEPENQQSFSSLLIGANIRVLGSPSNTQNRNSWSVVLKLETC
ncbi:hypothetical protein ScPMuIL_003198 [Solemya velum]